MWGIRHICPRLCSTLLRQQTTGTSASILRYDIAFIQTAPNLTSAVSDRKSKKHLIRLKGSKRQYVQEKDVISVWKGMTVKELAALVDKKPKELLQATNLIQDDPKFTHCVFPRRANDSIEETAIIRTLAEMTGYRIKYKPPKEVQKEDRDEYPLESRPNAVLKPRAPIVAIMGHVDHGKTTLLDSLRHSNVVAGEFGGITQHIGAFSVSVPGGVGGGRITFLDTPGHAAFSSMRARGARSTDIVILVVAADDGVMRQTEESLKYARAAGDPIIVAINKIDKPNADVEGTKQQLMAHGLELEEYGGDTQVVCVSALKGTGMDELQEAILAQAEQLQLKADVAGRCEGIVLEARTDAGGRGKLATVLLQHGTLKRGVWLVAGHACAKVRTIHSDDRRSLNAAGPALPVEISGWRELPEAGDVILQVKNEHRAHQVLRYRAEKAQEEKSAAAQVIIDQKQQEHQAEYHQLREQKRATGKTWLAIYSRIKSKEVIETHTGPELSVIVKADVTGSVEAILDMFAQYNDDRCRLETIGHDVGAVTTADVELAAPFGGIIYAFNVKVDDSVMELALSKGVAIKTHNVIYNLYDDLKTELTKQLPVGHEEEIVGQATVLAQISIKDGRRKVPVAGCRCTKGMLQKKYMFKLIRNDEVLYDGPVVSLKHLKNEVESVKNDVECGVRFEDTGLIPQPMDTIVCYHSKDVRQEIEWELES